MKRLTQYLLLIAGICLVLMAGMVMAQDDEGGDAEATEEPEIEISEFAGSRECRDCHTQIGRAHPDSAHALTMVEIEEDMDPEDNPIVGDFSQGEDARTVTFPEDDESRPFTIEDVAFTLGTGRNVQAYLYEIEEEVYQVFPAQWNSVSETWVQIDIGDEWPSEDYAFGPNCADCHTVGLTVENYEWEEEGVQCESCHGPGLDHVEAADDAGGSIDEEERAEIYATISLALDGQTCGQCHARGMDDDGIHPYPVEFYPGYGELTDGFDLYEPDDDEYWWPSGHAQFPNMQYNEALVSGHPDALADAQGRDSFGPECLTCHSATQHLIDLRLGNDDIDPETVDPMALVESHPNGVTCASCHDPHRVSDDDDEEEMVQLPANLRQESYQLCVDCHNDTDVTDGIHYPVQEVFEGISFIEEIEVEPSPHFTAEDGPDCATCHMPTIPTYFNDRNSHTFEIIAPGSALDNDVLEDSCSICHDEGPRQLQDLIDDIQNDTLRRLETARAAVTDESPDWVTVALDVIEGDGSAGIHNYTYTDELLDAVELQLNLVEN